MIIVDLFNLAIYQPLYNGLVFLSGIIPGNDIGVAIILLTILVKLVILPLSHKSVTTQATLRTLDPKIQDIKEKQKENKQEQATQIMNLYKEHGINPFTGCILTLIQIPIIFGLYFVFWKGLQNGINPDLIYSFVEIPPHVNFNFLKLEYFDLTQQKNIVLALIAGVSQYYQMKLALPPSTKSKKKNKKSGFSDELKKSLTTQARYILPLVITFISMGFPAAIPLYWSTNNLFSITHELVVKKRASRILSETKNP